MKQKTLEAWTAYYQNLNSNYTDLREELLQDYEKRRWYTITLEEVQKALQQLKNRKSLGMDNITKEEKTSWNKKAFQISSEPVKCLVFWKINLDKLIHIYKKGRKKVTIEIKLH